MRSLYKQDSWDKAAEMLALQPDLSLADIASACDVSLTQLQRWKKQSKFGEAMYTKYISTIGIHMPSVINSMIREAKLGNVQAARFVAEIGGKLIKRVSVQVESPYEQFLKHGSIKDAEIIDVVDQVAQKIKVVEELPPRNPINDKPLAKIRKDCKKVKKVITKSLKKRITPEQRAKNRKKSLDSYRRQKRAKKVGLEPLGRLKGEARRLWYAELEKREAEMGIE